MVVACSRCGNWSGSGVICEACQDALEKESLRRRVHELESMLEDVVNELDLSSAAIEEHGPRGTPPAELVRLVLDEKDKIIRMLKIGGKVEVV